MKINTEETEQTVRTPDASADERKLIKRSYGVSTTTMVLQLLLVLRLTGAFDIVNATILRSRIIAEHPGIDDDALKELFEAAIAQGGAMKTLLTFAGTALAFIIALAIGYKMIRTFSFRDTVSTKFRAKSVPLGVVGVLAIQPVSLAILAIVKMISGTDGSSQAAEKALTGNGDSMGFVIAMIYSVVFAALFEEIFFRGFMLSAMSPVSKNFAIIVSALLFSLLHANFGQFPNTFIVGLIHGYIAVKCGSILPNILAHMLTNAAAFAGGMMLENFGETAYIAFFVIEFVIAAPCLILFFIRNGKINNETDTVAPVSSDLPATSDNTVKLLLKCPSFWFIIVWELGTAFIQLAVTLKSM